MFCYVDYKNVYLGDASNTEKNERAQTTRSHNGFQQTGQRVKHAFVGPVIFTTNFELQISLYC